MRISDLVFNPFIVTILVLFMIFGYKNNVNKCDNASMHGYSSVLPRRAIEQPIHSLFLCFGTSTRALCLTPCGGVAASLAENKNIMFQSNSFNPWGFPVIYWKNIGTNVRLYDMCTWEQWMVYRIEFKCVYRYVHCYYRYVRQLASAMCAITCSFGWFEVKSRWQTTRHSKGKIDRSVGFRRNTSWSIWIEYSGNGQIDLPRER